MTTVLGWLLGGLKGIGGLFASLFRWIGNNPLQAIGAALLCILVWLLAFTIPALRSDLSASKQDTVAWKGRYAEEVEAHNSTIKGYIEKAELARQLDKANAARVKREGDVIAQSERDKNEIRIANLDARAERVREKLRAAQGDSISGRAEDLSELSEATCRAFGAASCEEHITALKDAQRSIDKLIGLQSFFAAVAGIDVNGETNREAK